MKVCAMQKVDVGGNACNDLNNFTCWKCIWKAKGELFQSHWV